MNTIKITGMVEDFPDIKPGAKTDGTPFKRIGFKIAGKKMSTFNEDYENFTKGEVVEVEYTVTADGKYNNIQKMTKVNDNIQPEVVVPGQKPAPTPTSTPVQTQVPTATPAKAINQNYYDSKKETEASIVAQVIIKSVTEMVSAGKIEPGSFKSNAVILVDTYKLTKKQLLE